MDDEFYFLHDVRQPPSDSNSKEVSQANIGSSVRFVRLLNINELKGVTCVGSQVSWSSQVFDEGCEFMMIPSILIKFNLSNELDFDTMMLQFLAMFLQCDVDLQKECIRMRHRQAKRLTFPETLSPSKKR